MIRAIVGNRTTKFECSPEEMRQLKKLFRYRKLGYYHSPKHQVWLREFRKISAKHPTWSDEKIEDQIEVGWDGYTNLMRYGSVPTGLLLDRINSVTYLNPWNSVVSDLRQLPDHRDLTIAFQHGRPSREYQRNAVETLVTHSGCGGILLCATRTGKTFIAAHYLKLLKGNACFIVDELSLMSQARDDMEPILEEEVGEIGMGKFSPERITVATIQTLHKHRNRVDFKKWFKSLDVLFIDEIHIAINKRNIDIVKTIKPKAVFGLTATLETDKPHVYMPACALAGPIIFRYEVKDGQADGWLSQADGYNVVFSNPMLSTGNQQQDYKRMISANAKRNQLVATIADEAVKAGRRVIVLVEHVHHLQRIAHMLDCEHDCIYGERKKDERRAAMKRMDEGNLPCILATRVFAKGVTIRTADVLIDATGFPSKNNAQQRFGRVLGQKDGKAIYVNIYDKGNRFSAAARSRSNAIKALGIKVHTIKWAGKERKIF